MNGPVVLIADNDRAVGGLLRELLSRSGAEVHMVEDGEAAKQRLALGGIDVLVCDLDMPRASGQDVAAWLATQPHQPVMIVVSGYVDEATRSQLEARPFVKHVWSKPFDLFAFRDAVLAVPRAAAAAATLQPAAEVPPLPAAGPEIPAAETPAPACEPEPTPAPVVVLEPQPPAAAPAAEVPFPASFSFFETCALPGVPRPGAAFAAPQDPQPGEAAS